ncbi:MAG: PAS domain S-box protein, partial [Desulfobacterales bacterium]|nr:PAS domain S-box protein [Desulfobacterales bacterium]
MTTIRGLKYFLQTTRAALILLALFLALGSGLDRAESDESGGHDNLLTAEERRWLSEREGRIRFAPSPDYAPIGYVDQERVFRGVTADYLELIEKRIGFQFKKVYCDDWSDIIDKARRGEIDVVGNIQDAPARREYLRFTAPYITIPNAIIVRKTFQGALDLDGMGGMKVAIGKNYASIDYVREKGPAITLVQVRDASEGLRMVSFGRADAMITDLAAASHVIETLGITNLRAAGEIAYSWRLAFASRKDWPVLHRILEKALASIGQAKRDEIFRKWIMLVKDKPFDYMKGLPFFAGALVIILLVAVWFLAWNRVLQNKVEKRTAEVKHELLEREKTEKTLKEAYEIINKSTSIAFLWKNEEGWPAQFVSANVEALFGYSQNEFLSGRIAYSKIIHPEDIDRVAEEVAEFCQEKERKRFTHKPYRVVTREGRIIWVEDKTFIRRDENGEITHIQGIVEDVTDQKHVVEALRDSEEKLSQIVDGSPVATFVVNDRHIVTHWNRACEFLTGVLRDEVVGTSNHWGAFYPEKRSVLADLIIDGASAKKIRMAYGDNIKKSDLVEGAYYTERFFPHLGSGGLWLYFTAAPLRDHAGQLVGAIETLQNFTYRKKSEEEVRKSEERYRTLHANVPVGVFRTTPEGNLLSVNPAFIEMLGYESEEELMDVSIPGLHGDPKKNKAYLEQLKSEGNIKELEVKMHRKDGSKFWGSTSATRVDDEDGEFIHVDGILKDITERKLAEREKSKLQTQLRQAQKMEAIGTLAGGIAHDFNNILSAVIGYTDLAFHEVEKETPLHGHLEEVLKAGERARDLVEQILTFSRQSEQDLKPIQLKLIVKEALKLLRASLPSTIEIQSDIHSDFSVLADATQIHQVLMNLCTNAAHAMRTKGGVLDVKLQATQLDADYTVNFPDLEPGPFVKLTVSDTGHGMSREVIDRIFDPFYTTKKKGEGTGMGLSVVHGIAKSHG